MEVSIQLKFTLHRTLQTPHSCRVVVAQENGQPAALVDLHRPAEGKAEGTLIVVEGGPLTRDDVPEFLAQISEALLPDHPEAVFTVVFGQVLGVCGSPANEPPAAPPAGDGPA